MSPLCTTAKQPAHHPWYTSRLSAGPGAQGYEVWIDGIFMARTKRTGGEPILNVTELVLCGRSDLGAQRFFDGRIAHLAVYDVAINSATVWPSCRPELGCCRVGDLAL